MKKGVLYLLPVPLAENSVAAVIPPLHAEIINRVNHYIVENEKTARHWLKTMGLRTPQSELKIQVFGKHSDKQNPAGYLRDLEQGQDVVLMSEAGCPAIADPGSEIVAAAHTRKITVCPLTGPSSILLALMASGFNGQNFAFHGYLPIDKDARAKKIKELDLLAGKNGQTQLFIETPFRNNALFEELMRSCSPGTLLCVAANLTAETENILTARVSEWRTFKPDLHKIPVIFLIAKPGAGRS